LKGEATQKFH